MYFAIASSATDKTFSRAFNKALMNVTQTLLTTRFDRAMYNVTLDTLTIDLPDNGSFSAGLLENLCGQFEGKHVVAVLIVGESPAALTVSMAAEHAGIPVLWTRGHSGFVTALRSMVSR